MSKIGFLRLPPQGFTQDWLRWFYRRPFFWWAMAALGGVYLAYASPMPAGLWAGVALLGAVVAFSISREAGTLLAVASLFGAAAAGEKTPTAAAHLREGAAVTLTGVVLEAPTAGRTVLEVRDRLTLQGWLPERSRVGVRIGELPVEPGTLLEVSGRLHRPLPQTNPGGFDDRLRWLRRGVHWIAEPRPAGLRVLGKESAPGWRRLAAQVRGAVLERNRETLSPTGALLANSFLLGEEQSADAELSERISAAFRDSGTIHLLVVSGTQVSLVMGLFLWLGWRVWRFRYLCWALGAGAVAGFWLLTDGSASVSRAGLMGGILVLGLALQREPDGENCLGIAALVLLAFNRFAAFDIGAQLSFAAVWGLVRVAPALYRVLGPDPGKGASLRPAHAAIAGVVAVSLAAHLATAPILAYHFQRVSWSGVMANVPMSVLTLVFTYGALLHVLLGAVGAPLLAGGVDLGALSFTGWAGFFAQAPFGAREVFPFPLWLVPLYYAGLTLPGALPAARRLTVAVLGGLCGALWLAERLPAPPPPHPVLRAIDIGQGDALLLQGTAGENILVDAGRGEPGRPVSSLVRALRGLRVSSLDAVVVTHADSDHAGGLLQLLGRMPVRLLIHRVDPAPEEAELWTRVQRLSYRLRIPSLTPAPGDRLRIRGSSLLFLGPLEAARGNEASLVCRWDAGPARFLLTGDAGFPAEHQLLAWGPELRSDVLKVGHHGSAESTGAEWLQAVEPRLAVVSCGRQNAFGHPAAEVLERLETAGVTVSRTDRSGMVTIWLERGRIRVREWVRKDPEDGSPGSFTF